MLNSPTRKLRNLTAAEKYVCRIREYFLLSEPAAETLSYFTLTFNLIIRLDTIGMTTTNKFPRKTMNPVFPANRYGDNRSGMSSDKIRYH